jgi:hypothetical protein
MTTLDLFNEFEVSGAEYLDLGITPPPDPPSAPQQPLELTYHPALPKELAVAPHERAKILAYYGLSEAEYDKLTDSLNFRKDLSRWQQEVTKEGFTLKLKSLGYAEELLPDLHTIFKSVDTPSQIKVKIMELLLGVAGVATKSEPETPGALASMNPVQININLG